MGAHEVSEVSIMSLNDYQALAVRTANQDLSYEEQVQNWSLGLVGELGEVCELFKKYYWHGKKEAILALEEEAGDVAWYVANLAHALGLDLDKVGNLRSEVLVGDGADPLVDLAVDARRRAQGFTADNQRFISGLLFSATSHVGEIAKLVYQGFIDGDPRANALRITDRLGSLLLVIAVLGVVAQTDLVGVLSANVEKLRVRYPEGFPESLPGEKPEVVH